VVIPQVGMRSAHQTCSKHKAVLVATTAFSGKPNMTYLMHEQCGCRTSGKSIKGEAHLTRM